MSPELWIVYAQTSRAGKPATAQLVELERPDGCRLVDLEDVLDYVVSQGFVDVQHRPMCWWESCHGERLSASRVVLDLVASGNGHCPEHALKLVIADIPIAVWVRYVYLHTPRAHTATQRIRLGHPHCAPHDHLAHVTNYIFARGYLPARQRACVYWETPCGRRVGEETRVHELLAAREGTTEEHALRLVIDL